jgi:hypothetical protein
MPWRNEAKAADQGQEQLSSARALLYEHFLLVQDFSGVYSAPASWRKHITPLQELGMSKRTKRPADSVFDGLPITFESDALVRSRASGSRALSQSQPQQSADVFFMLAMIAPSRQKRVHTDGLRTADLCVHLCSVVSQGIDNDGPLQVSLATSSTSVLQVFSIEDSVRPPEIVEGLKRWRRTGQSGAVGTDTYTIDSPMGVFRPREGDVHMMSRWELLTKLLEHGWEQGGAAGKKVSPYILGGEKRFYSKNVAAGNYPDYFVALAT